MKGSVFSGFHSIEEILRKQKMAGVLYLSRSSRRNNGLADLAKAQGYQVSRVSEGELSRLAAGVSHRGILFAAQSGGFEKSDSKPGSGGKTTLTLESYLSGLTDSEALVLILDGITDPHNLGAVIRSSDQFYVDLILVPSRNSARDNSTVSKTSAGADNYVNIDVVTNLSRSIDRLKEAGFWIYGADMGGENISSTDLTGRVALVMGSEGKGLRDLTRTKCDTLLSIPAKGHIDSFNVSVAAGIMMYEIRRQQNLP